MLSVLKFWRHDRGRKLAGFVGGGVLYMGISGFVLRLGRRWKIRVSFSRFGPVSFDGFSFADLWPLYRAPLSILI
jgi:hypothetical protein